jgi:hypothetical protein
MKKPWWLRLIGLAALLSAAAVGVGFAISPGLFRMPWMLPVLVGWTLVTVGLFMAWLLVGGMIWVANHSARAQAAITCDVLIELVKRMQLQPATGLELPERGAWDNPPTGITCDKCKRPNAMLHCEKHKVSLCFPCTGQHDVEDCRYIAADRHAQGPQKPTSRTKTIGKLLGI